jgi:glycosyltransferase involved in cell wall biosynthesis
MAPFIERAIKSVLSQTYSDFQLIVIDDGSTDGGGEIVKNIKDPRLHVICQENQGVSVARNTGITEANSELIVFLDADDHWKPKFLEEIIRLKQEFPQAGIYATAYQTINQHGITTPSFQILPSGKKRGLINFFKVLKYNAVIIQAVAIPKKIFEEVGGFHHGEFILEDLDLLLRVALRYPVAWSNEPLVMYYQLDWHEKNSKRFRRINREPRVVHTIREAVANGAVPSENLSLLKEAAATIMLGQARYLLEYGNEKLGQSFIRSALNFNASLEGRLMGFAASLPGNIYYRVIIPLLRDLKNKLLSQNLFRDIYSKLKAH